MDHHRPLGRLPLRIALRGLLALLAVVWLPACAGGPSALDVTTTSETPTTTTAAATTTTAPTTTTSTTTTTVAPTSTTTSIPRQAWQMDGRAYYFPVQPPEIATYSAYHHDYPATDIFAPTGSAFVAVTNGVIDELRAEDSWDPAVDDGATRGGRFVSLIGDDGVRYYCSHLDSVAEGLQSGDRVEAGRILGTIGNSGDAAPTPPHCHFGISRPTDAGNWAVRRGEVWPFEYLQAWTRGEDVTPVLPEG